MSSQVKMEKKDYVEVFNPWNRDVQLLEIMLESQDSMQKETNMKEGKDEREAIKISEKRVTETV